MNSQPMTKIEVKVEYDGAVGHWASQANACVADGFVPATTSGTLEGKCGMSASAPSRYAPAGRSVAADGLPDGCTR